MLLKKKKKKEANTSTYLSHFQKLKFLKYRTDEAACFSITAFQIKLEHLCLLSFSHLQYFFTLALYFGETNKQTRIDALSK